MYLTLTFLLFILKSTGGDLNIQRGCWPNNIVPYIISEGFFEREINIIHQQIAILHNATCVRWVDLNEKKFATFAFVEFVKVTGRTCQTIPSVRDAERGRFVSYIQLSQWCLDSDTIMHEMLHVLGIKHEHQRTDRDCYVDIAQEIVSDQSYKILLNSEDDGDWLERFPYDKYSILHFPGSNEMKAKNERWFHFWEPLGNMEGVLTALDLWKLLYKFCDYPHFCDVDPLYCQRMEENEKNCTLQN